MSPVQKCAISKTIRTCAITVGIIIGIVLYFAILPHILNIHVGAWLFVHFAIAIMGTIIVKLIYITYEHHWDQCNLKLNGVPMPREEHGGW